MLFSAIALGIFLFVSPSATRPTYKVTEYTSSDHSATARTVTTICGSLKRDDPKAAVASRDFDLTISGGQKLTITTTDVQGIDECS